MTGPSNSNPIAAPATARSAITAHRNGSRPRRPGDVLGSSLRVTVVMASHFLDVGDEARDLRGLSPEVASSATGGQVRSHLQAAELRLCQFYAVAFANATGW